MKREMQCQSCKQVVKQYYCDNCQLPIKDNVVPVSVHFSWPSVCDGKELNFCSDICYSEYCLGRR